jgi:indole-3-pyruvate monooxygenase
MSTYLNLSETNTSHDAAHNDTIIVGAGPAGLAVGACLKRAGLPFLILEQAYKVAAVWYRHYDRLHLHTAKAYSELPFFPFPKDYPRYPSRLPVISYLEAYARQFQLEPKFGQQVIAACHTNGAWEVRTQTARYQAMNSEYRNGEPFRSQKVLVVGFGNSGGEIVIDLWEHGALPGLAVRGPVNVVIPRELLGIPILAIAIAQRRLPPRWADAINAPIVRAVVGDLTRYGLRKLPRGPITQIQAEAHIPLIDVGTIKLIKRGEVPVYPGIERFTEDGVIFADGRQRKFDAVILATGYRPRINKFLDGASTACDENGTPLSSGYEMAIPGLYFCGYHVSPTGMLREIALEARRISAAIALRRMRPANV